MRTLFLLATIAGMILRVLVEKLGIKKVWQITFQRSGYERTIDELSSLDSLLERRMRQMLEWLAEQREMRAGLEQLVGKVASMFFRDTVDSRFVALHMIYFLDGRQLIDLLAPNEEQTMVTLTAKGKRYVNHLAGWSERGESEP